MSKIKNLIISILFTVITLHPVQLFALETPQLLKDILNSIGIDPSEADNAFSSLPSEEDIYFQSVGEYMEITSIPKTPHPNETVSLKTISYLTDLNRAEIFWYVNDILKEKGTGRTTFEFTVGDSGSVNRVDVVIKTIEGYRIDKQLIFNPVALEILWEADTYTPPFYKGKALATPTSWLKIVAMPRFVETNGRKVDENSLVYVWKKDRRTIQEYSGYGKNSIFTQAPIPYGDAKIEVSASSFNNSLASTQEIDIDLVDPEIIFYENNPIHGIMYEKAIGRSFELTKQEISVRAEPYFFANDDKKAGNLLYEWYLNNASVPGIDKEITFRQEEVGEGSANINLAIRNTSKTFQIASKSFDLNFKNAGVFNF